MVGNNQHPIRGPYQNEDIKNYKVVDQSDINNRLLKETKPMYNHPIENLEEFTDEQVETQAYQLAKEQLGCRFLQKKLEDKPKFGIKLYVRVTQP
jgi:hypothetical protein